MLARLVRQAAGRVTILAGGGVRAPTIRAFLAATGVREVHLRAMRPVASGPPHGVGLSGDAARYATSAEEIADFLRASRGEGLDVEP